MDFMIPWAISVAGERASTMEKAISAVGERASTMREDTTALGAMVFMTRKGIWSTLIEKPICGRDLSRPLRGSASAGVGIRGGRARRGSSCRKRSGEQRWIAPMDGTTKYT